MMATGRPWDELEDTLTVPRLEALQRYWREHPPVHILVAGAVGFKAPEATPELPRDDPSVKIGVNILAMVNAARKANPSAAVAGDNDALFTMFRDGLVRM